MNALVVTFGLALFLLLSYLPLFRKSEAWSATVTPLASIMGSGFLISAPLLASIVGHYSPLVMAGLLIVAWLIGGAIRFNIANVSQRSDSEKRGPSGNVEQSSCNSSGDHRLHRSHSDSLVHEVWRDAKSLVTDLGESGDEIHSGSFTVINALEKASQLVLALAYVISVTYYIQLLGSFLFNALSVDAKLAQAVVAAGILGGIACTGYLFGLKVIERVEKYAINLNLSVIVSMIIGLAVHNYVLWQSGDWSLPRLDVKTGDWDALRFCLGLLVIVQGFETSRFLGAEHSAKLRVRTMRWAQGISSFIYMTFLALMMVVVTREAANQNVDVTAIVGLVGVVASILPLLVTVAAVGSQFSAAVADEAGCGGLLSQLLGKYANDRTAYLLIGGVTVVLAFSVNVLQIVSLASRAFATFYCFQCAIACVYAWNSNDHSKLRAIGYGVLTLVALTITLLAKSVEG